MTSSNTASGGPSPRRPVPVDAPALAQYRQLNGYTPTIGDFIVWAGFFSTWYGVVSGVRDDTVYIIWEKLPMILFTLTGSEQDANRDTLGMDRIRGAPPGTFAVMQRDPQHNVPIWYI